MASAVTSSTDGLDAVRAGIDAARNKDKAGSADGAQDRFLKLLTTQLRAQDPLNPMDNAQMTSQLAQISTVEGIEKLNKTLQALTQNSADSQTLQAAALVGHSVLATGSGLSLASGKALGGVDVAAPADKVTVTITDANGLAVRTLDLGARAAGSHAFAWDGLTDNGAKAVDGRYTISVQAVRGGEKVAAEALQLSAVAAVERGAAGGISINLSSGETMPLSAVRKIL